MYLEKCEIEERRFGFIFYFSDIELERQNNFLFGNQWVNDSWYKSPLLR